MFEFEFFNPVRTVFGLGKFSTAGEETAKLGKKALLVCYDNPGILQDVLDTFTQQCGSASVDVVPFFQVEENPEIATVARGAQLARDEKCDCVVAVGGGSPMDAAKAIAAAVFYEGDPWNMVSHRHDGSAEIKPPEKALPLLMIPTLPATGSEMNMCSVISNAALKEKSYIWSECCFPKTAILDPQLTASLPAFQSACAAADAISHVLEIYINSREDTPLQNAWQEGCMRTTIENIRLAVTDPGNMEARGNLMWAATCSINGWAYPGDGWTPIHQVGHVLTSRHGVSHGQSLCVLMLHWMRYNAARRPLPYRNFAVNVMGVDPAGKTDEQVMTEGINAFEAFLKEIGLPTTLGEVNIGEADLEDILAGVVKVSFGDDGNLKCNPGMSREDVMNVLRSAL